MSPHGSHSVSIQIDWAHDGRHTALDADRPGGHVRLGATTRNARGANHHVYTLLHDPRGASRWGVYVGETSRDPDVRIDQPKTGYKASRHATRFGVWLLPALVEHLNPLRRWEAVELEAALAEELRRAGIDRVEGGH